MHGGRVSYHLKGYSEDSECKIDVYLPLVRCALYSEKHLVIRTRVETVKVSGRAFCVGVREKINFLC